MTKHNEELASHAAELLDMIRSHQYGLRGFGDGSLSRGRNLTDKERCTIEQALRLATAGEQKPVALPELTVGQMKRIADCLGFREMTPAILSMFVHVEKSVRTALNGEAK